jgi:hypothetical protein
MIFDHFIYAIRLVNWDWAAKLRLGSEREYNKILQLNRPPNFDEQKKRSKTRNTTHLEGAKARYKKTAKKSWTFISV